MAGQHLASSQSAQPSFCSTVVALRQLEQYKQAYLLLLLPPYLLQVCVGSSQGSLMLGLNLWGLHQHGNTTQHTTAWHNAEQRHQQQQQQGQSLSTTHGASHHTEIQVTLAITDRVILAATTAPRSSSTSPHPVTAACSWHSRSKYGMRCHARHVKLPAASMHVFNTLGQHQHGRICPCAP